MKTLSLCLAIALVVTSTSIALPQPPAAYDLVIINARIIDGTGNPWFRGSIAITGGRIVKVGRLDKADAKFVLDAKNQIVAPGFIDVHAHTEDIFNHPTA